MTEEESVQRRHGIAADDGTCAAFRSLCSNAAASQGATLVAAAGYTSENSSADGRFQLVTAIVQLLLDRQQRQQGRTVPQDGTGSAAEAAVEALKRQVLTSEAATAKPAPSPEPSHGAAQPRPAQPAAASITHPMPSPSPLQPSSSETPVEKELRIRHSKQERSNASILALAHTLIAAHAKPQLGESDPQTQRLKKPLVPRRRRRPHRRPTAEGGQDSAANSGSESGGFGRPVRQPPCAPVRLPPASRRPAWAQLVHAAPAEQEQALLDWVNSVDAVPAEQSAPPESQQPTDSEELTRPTSPTEPAQFAA